MALTLDRWMALAIGGCLIALTLILREPAEPLRRDNPRRFLAARQEALSNASATATHRLRHIQLRDSIRAAAGPVRGGGRLLVGPSFSPDDRVRLNSFNERIALQQRQGSAGPVDRVFVIDTLTRLRNRNIAHGAFATSHFLPAAGYDRCMALGMFGGQTVGGRIIRNEWFNTEENAGRFLGPCAFYARFGAPGPAIGRWLRSGGWAFGTAGAHPRILFAETSIPSAWFAPQNAGRYDLGSSLRFYVSTAGFRCASGDGATCVTSLLEPQTNRRGKRVRALESGLLEASDRYWWNSTTLGPFQGWLLADMAWMIGDDNFRKFWSSSQPPVEAFAAATGQDLGNWITTWTRKSYGEVGRGPAIPANSLSWSVVVVLLALGAAIAASSRRQVA